MKHPDDGHAPSLRGLRRLRSDDAQDVLDAFRSHPDMARQGEVTTLEQAQEYVDRLVDPEGPHRVWAVLDPDAPAGPAVVGVVGVSVDAANRNGWFWYWMNVSHRGRGLTTGAARAVADWALADEPGAGLHRLELGHRVNNTASAAVARAAGFVRRAWSGRSSWWTASESMWPPTGGCARIRGRPQGDCRHESQLVDPESPSAHLVWPKVPVATIGQSTLYSSVSADHCFPPRRHESARSGHGRPDAFPDPDHAARRSELPSCAFSRTGAHAFERVEPPDLPA